MRLQQTLTCALLTCAGLLTDGAVPELEVNHITGPLACSGNTPTLNQTGNGVIGPCTGQCM